MFTITAENNMKGLFLRITKTYTENKYSFFACLKWYFLLSKFIISDTFWAN